jgi:hypothetical protein
VKDNMGQAVNSLSAYSVTNFSGGGGAGFDLRGVQVEIGKVENGFIFKLSGSKQAKAKKKDEFFDRWESFNATFVYQDLDTGLAEVKDFFALIEKQLNKKVAEVEKRSYKPRKKGKKTGKK